MKVEFVKPTQGYAYCVGDVGEIEDDEAKRLIELGFVVQAKPDTDDDDIDGLKKTEIIDQLNELGVEFDEKQTKAQLLVILKANK